MHDGRARGTALLQGIAKHEHANWADQSPIIVAGKKGVKGQSNDQREGHFYALICPECHCNMAFLTGKHD